MCCPASEKTALEYTPKELRTYRPSRSTGLVDENEAELLANTLADMRQIASKVDKKKELSAHCCFSLV